MEAKHSGDGNSRCEHQNPEFMTQTTTQIRSLQAVALPNSLREMVDLVGIEPTTTSMPSTQR
jgi:hypothetical protein